MLQVPVTLEDGATAHGTSKAVDANGTTTRIEDWTVSVQGKEDVEIQGHKIQTWVVQIDRQSRPGTSEQVTRSRTYWFDPQTSLWLKWHEKMNGSQPFGPGRFTYTTEFTATLNRVEALTQPPMG
jgi:hypothetical protein